MRVRTATGLGVGIVGIVGAGLIGFGCGGHPRPPLPMAPPMAGFGPGYGGGTLNPPAQTQQVYAWQDVPSGQQVPIARAIFDQGGYQLLAGSGETIVVPFVNQNLYAMRFGRAAGGQTYFVNDNGVPTLYLPNGAYLESAAAQGSRWFPLPQEWADPRPVYVGVAPSWSDFAGMGWYPGMVAYGGPYGYNAYGSGFSLMPGFYIAIGGTRYGDWGSYRGYYSTHTGYVHNRRVYNNYNTLRTGSYAIRGRSTSPLFGSRPFGGSNSSNSRSFGGGTFGRAGSSTSGSTGSGSFGRGSFGSGATTRPGSSPFGGTSSGSPRFGSGTFGSPRSGNGNFGGGGSIGGGGGRTSGQSGGSFGGTRGFGSGSRPSSGSFGGTRGFGGSSGSFGGGSFSGGRRSGGSGFGGGRRR